MLVFICMESNLFYFASDCTLVHNYGTSSEVYKAQQSKIVLETEMFSYYYVLTEPATDLSRKVVRQLALMSPARDSKTMFCAACISRERVGDSKLCTTKEFQITLANVSLFVMLSHSNCMTEKHERLDISIYLCTMCTCIIRMFRDTEKD